MKKVERELFIGIDLGGKKKKTTGICILAKAGKQVFPLESYCPSCEDVFGKEILKKIDKYLTRVRNSEI